MMINFSAMRKRNLGSPQRCYADDHGMWMDTHAQQQQQQQQSYAFHEESWSSDNNNNSYHKQQFPAGMHVKNPMDSMSKHHGYVNNGHHGYGMFENKPNGHHGYGYNMHDGGKKLGGINSSHHHQFPNGVATKFNSGHGHHHGYSSEESCEEYEEELHHGAGKVKKNEMRYEHHNNWGGDHAYYANPYDHHMNMHGKPHHGHGGHNHKIEWIAKGV